MSDKTLQSYIRKEREGIEELERKIDYRTEEAVKALSGCEGKVVFIGVGKSAHIGRKLAATFASTGTPSFFVHATEAVHGDLGMISKEDIVVALSYSGKRTSPCSYPTAAARRRCCRISPA